MPLGVPCDHTVAIVDLSNAAQPFILPPIWLYRLSLLISATMLTMCQV